MDSLERIAREYYHVVLGVSGGVVGSVVAVKVIQSWLTSHKYRSWGQEYKQRCDQRLHALEQKLATQKVVF